MKVKSRSVHFYDLVLSSRTRVPSIANPSCCSLEELLQRLGTVSPSGTEVIKRATYTIEVADWANDSASCGYAMLLNCADRDVSDIALKDFSTRVRRKAGKTIQEGIEESCHVLIKPGADGRRALLLMTMGSGVTFSAVEKALRELIKAVKAKSSNDDLFRFPEPTGAMLDAKTPVTYAVDYSVQLVAHKGTALDDALTHGSFVSMELISHAFKNFDAGGNLQEERQSVFVTAAKSKVGSLTASLVKKAIRTFVKQHATTDLQYDNVRIAYTAPDGQIHHNTLQTNDLDQAFTKRVSIELQKPVDAQQLKLSETVLSAMRELLT